MLMTRVIVFGAELKLPVIGKQTSCFWYGSEIRVLYIYSFPRLFSGSLRIIIVLLVLLLVARMSQMRSHTPVVA